MKGLFPLFLGLFGTFAFSWVGLTLIPNYQIGHLDPQSDEEGTDVYPLPKSGMAERGRRVYTANGCFYCHSRWVRADYAGSDIERKWGDRRSAPRDYIFDRPVLLGKMRTGPDLSNIGQRAPLEDENAAPAASPPPAAAGAPAASPSAAAAAGSPASPPTGAAAGSKAPPTAAGPSASPAAGANSPAASAPASNTAQAPSAKSSLGSENKPNEAPVYSAAWHHRHLYAPRSISTDSNMPAYKFLYEKRPIGGQTSADALKLTGSDAPPAGSEIVPTYEARCLVAFLMSLNESHPLNETKSAFGAPAPPAAAAPAASPAASAAAPPAK
ncbi:MAG: hypothetical protein JWO45_21 [Spartobacteria bacterium]|nr:hypothetical protein [Spartobacteria bacterium]